MEGRERERRIRVGTPHFCLPLAGVLERLIEALYSSILTVTVVDSLNNLPDTSDLFIVRVLMFSSILGTGPVAFIYKSFSNLFHILGFHHHCSHSLVSGSLRIRKGRKETSILATPLLPSTPVASATSPRLTFPICTARVALAELRGPPVLCCLPWVLLGCLGLLPALSFRFCFFLHIHLAVPVPVSPVLTGYPVSHPREEGPASSWGPLVGCLTNLSCGCQRQLPE